MRWLMGMMSACAAACVGGAAFAEEAASAKLPPAVNRAVDFDKDVRPIFEAHCHKCHGAEKQKSGLRLDDRASAMRGGDTGKAFEPGQSATSLLIELTAGIDPAEVMPPKGERLTAEQVGVLRAWIDQGANWPQGVGGSRLTSDHWSLKPLVRPALPQVRGDAWVRNPIDRFILAKLESKDIVPAGEADRATLIRRLSFDLLGLPPTPEQTAQFVADDSPDAYEKLVDRLLASPHYGERWARHWLDVVRYTESQGFEYDRLRPNAWHYRDYVVAAFNGDKPYDRFVREQIAGDAMQPVTREGLVATSLLVCGPWDQAGNGQANQTQRKITREEELEDLVSVIGQTFLGLTINCARCHSHKFDPIPQADYYRLKAVFEGVRHGERSIVPAEEVEARKRHNAEVEGKLRLVRERVAALESMGRARVGATDDGSRPGSQGLAGAGLVARWTFDGDARDTIGAMHGELLNGARIENSRLVLDGKSAVMRTTPLDRDITEKTLEAWVALDTLEQGGGGVIGLETNNGAVFDAIVYGEREPGKWIAGSNSFVRTRDLAAKKETTTPGELVHMAIVYRADGSIALYRNGARYADAYTPSSPLQHYKAGEARVLLGQRHTGGGRAFLSGSIERASLYDRALSDEQVAESFRLGGGIGVTERRMLAALTEAERAEREDLLKQAEALRAALAPMPDDEKSYIGVREQPPVTHRLVRGSVTEPAEAVSPGGLSVIHEPSGDFGLSPDAPEAERRLRLAAWMTDPRHPLTARVMVNRVWHYHFGRGLAATPNDLGEAGAAPTHPELIDYLAATFIEQGWSIKRLHRLIVTSATYRQASSHNASAAAVDADNELLWAYPIRRLEGEAVRDAMLSISGRLNPAMGGPSYRPFEVTSHGSDFYHLFDKPGPEYERRTLYRMNVNSGKDPMLDVFDCPDPSVKAPNRRATTTPLQALALMNNSFVQRQARSFAERVMNESKGDANGAIELAYRYAFGRSPSDDERAVAIEHVTEHGMANLCWVLFNASEFLYVR